MHNDYLAHYGVKGQKWGVRRYQNKNGTLTPAGKKKQRKENVKRAAATAAYATFAVGSGYIANERVRKAFSSDRSLLNRVWDLTVASAYSEIGYYAVNRCLNFNGYKPVHEYVNNYLDKYK